jgi:PAS domain S-box-containing protein
MPLDSKSTPSRGGVAKWRRFASVAALLLGAGSAAFAEDRAQRILILYPDSNMNRAASIVGETIQKRLSEQAALDIQIHGEFLDLARFPDAAHKRRAVQYLSEKYAASPPDLVLGLGPDALRIAIDNRNALAAGAPITFCCISPNRLATIDKSDDVTGIISDFDVAKTVQLARALQPNARQLVVVSGAAPFDVRSVETARQQLAKLPSQLDTRYIVGLPREELLRELAQLSRDTIVVLLTIFRDGAGRDFIPAEIGGELARASGAPVYGFYDVYLGRGIVGGHMDTFAEIGNQTADLVLKVLSKQAPQALQTSTTQRFRVDARELERWGLSASNLPADTIVMFKKPDIWVQHSDDVVAAMGAFAGMTLVLGLLMAQIMRRRKVETHLRESEERLGFAAASAGIGLWHYDLRTGQLWASDHCREMFGMPVGRQLTNEALINAVHPDDRRVAIASIRAATYGNFADGVSEFRLLPSAGEVRWLEARGRTSRDSDGHPSRVSGIFRDITRFKAAQLEAKQLSQRVISIQDEERERIAQELHDSTAQHLAAIGLNLIALKGANGGHRTSMIFKDIEESLEEATRELRTFTYLLHPPALTNDGLTATLRRYVEGFRKRTGLDVTLRGSGAADQLSSPSQQSVLRIVQEALANVHRHARASRARVNVRRVGRLVHLVIADDGRGLATKNGGKRDNIEMLPVGVGIAGMAARVRHLGGKLDIRSRPRGTSVHAILPLATPDSQLQRARR